MTAQEVVVIDLAKEANTLAVTALRIGKAHLGGYATHLALGEVADRKYDVLQLVVGDAREEVSLVLDRVGSSGEPLIATVVNLGGGIVPRGGDIKLVSPTLLEEAKFDDEVAHHIGVGGTSFLDCLQGIIHDVLPILLVEWDHLERQVVTRGDELTHLDILLVGAVARVVVASDADIEEVHIVSLLDQSMNSDSRVNASRNQCSDSHQIPALVRSEARAASKPSISKFLASNLWRESRR